MIFIPRASFFFTLYVATYTHTCSHMYILKGWGQNCHIIKLVCFIICLFSRSFDPVQIWDLKTFPHGTVTKG